MLTRYLILIGFLTSTIGSLCAFSSTAENVILEASKLQACQVYLGKISETIIWRSLNHFPEKVFGDDLFVAVFRTTLDTDTRTTSEWTRIMEFPQRLAFDCKGASPAAFCRFTASTQVLEYSVVGDSQSLLQFVAEIKRRPYTKQTEFSIIHWPMEKIERSTFDLSLFNVNKTKAPFILNNIAQSTNGKMYFGFSSKQKESLYPFAEKSNLFSESELSDLKNDNVSFELFTKIQDLYLGLVTHLNQISEQHLETLEHLAIKDIGLRSKAQQYTVRLEAALASAGIDEKRKFVADIAQVLNVSGDLGEGMHPDIESVQVPDNIQTQLQIGDGKELVFPLAAQKARMRKVNVLGVTKLHHLVRDLLDEESSAKLTEDAPAVLVTYSRNKIPYYVGFEAKALRKMSFEEALSSYVVAASVLGNLDTATVQVAEKTIRQLKAYQMGTKQEDLVIPLSGLTRSNGTLREGFRKNNILISPYVALGQKPSRENLLKRPPAIVMIPAPLSEAQRASLNELLRTEDRILEKRSKKQAVQKDEDSDSAKPSDAIEIILEFCTSTTPFIPAPHRKALEEALNALAVASDEKYKEFVRELEGDGMMGVEVVLKESVFPALRQATSVETIETLLLLEKLINILEVRKERVK